MLNQEAVPQLQGVTVQGPGAVQQSGAVQRGGVGGAAGLAERCSQGRDEQQRHYQQEEQHQHQQQQHYQQEQHQQNQHQHPQHYHQHNQQQYGPTQLSAFATASALSATALNAMDLSPALGELQGAEGTIGEGLFDLRAPALVPGGREPVSHALRSPERMGAAAAAHALPRSTASRGVDVQAALRLSTAGASARGSRRPSGDYGCAAATSAGSESASASMPAFGDASGWTPWGGHASQMVMVPPYRERRQPA
jgi:hypothetical protein